MSAFETVGATQLLAFEGQRQIASALASALRAVMHKAGQVLVRHSAGTLLP